MTEQEIIKRIKNREFAGDPDLYEAWIDGDFKNTEDDISAYKRYSDSANTDYLKFKTICIDYMTLSKVINAELIFDLIECKISESAVHDQLVTFKTLNSLLPYLVKNDDTTRNI